MNQLELEAIAPKKSKRNPREGMCKCGHEELGHDLPKGHRTRKQCSRCGCPKFRSRMRKKVPLVVPAGAVILFRPDTVSEAHPMGWRDFTVGVEGASLIAYLHQLRTRTPNEYNARQDNERFKAQKAEERERQVTCTHAALELGVPMRSKPKKITVARVSSRKIRDDDNLVGALKWIRDGIADALKIDDSEFSIFAAEGKIPLVYEQRLSGKLGVYGVRIEIEWRTA